MSYQSIPLCTIKAADKWVFYAVRTRNLKIEVPNGESSTTVLLRDALHTPNMGVTIVSISRITKAGYKVAFEASTCKIKNPSSKVISVIPHPCKRKWTLQSRPGLRGCHEFRACQSSDTAPAIGPHSP